MYAVTVDLDAGAPVRSRVEPGSGGDVRNQVTSGWAAAQHPPAAGMPTPGKTPCAAAALLCSSRGRRTGSLRPGRDRWRSMRSIL